jgi:hypothetical protein
MDGTKKLSEPGGHELPTVYSSPTPGVRKIKERQIHTGST